ncbi:hypothetical protein KY285_005048 [Solanum tuberosum]|nr:hypothetical protein KY285_005048 [Solanum tuberosum]
MAVVESAVKYALAHESAVLAQTRLSPRKFASSAILPAGCMGGLSLAAAFF